MVAEPVQRSFTVDEYYRMADAGILTREDRVELIEGRIIQMPPIGGPHASRVTQMTEMFVLAFRNRAVVIPQNPLRLSQYSEPEPDLMLARRRPDFYRERHPVPADVFLVVEVSDSTVTFDRQVKLPLYAREGIPEVWLVEIPSDVLTVHRNPTPEGYRTTQILRRGEFISVEAFPDVQFPVDDILG